VFQVQKPYFEFNAANQFTQLGTIRNRGAELSFSGAATPRLDVVAGAVVSDPKVTGEAVTLGRVGRDPVYKPKVRIDLNLDWRLPILNGVTLDSGLTYISRRAATTNDRVYLPGRTLIDLGLRYAFKIDHHATQLQLSITNIADVYGFSLGGTGVYDTIPGRVAQLSLGIDT